MNPTDENLESILRAAPRPCPPADLKPKLLADAAELGVRVVPLPSSSAGTPEANWRDRWRAWWPTALAASLLLASFATWAWQQRQIRELRSAVEALRHQTDPIEPRIPAAPPKEAQPPPAVPAVDPRADLERLRSAAAQLRPEVARLEAMAAENAALSRTPADGASALDADLEWAQEARTRALSIQCANNLKQLGLAARIWSNDNQEVLPPDIISMTNELSTPKVLWCPGDTARQPASDWASYSAANCSYEHLAPSALETEPTRVLARCPVHGHVALCDGSVQMRVGLEHPEWLVTRDGKLYLEH